MKPKRCTMCRKRARAGYFTCSEECADARKWRQVSLNRHRQRSKVPGTYDVTVEDWMNILRAFNHTCVYCNRRGLKLTVDHVVPLSRGGRHCIANIVPACANCNHKKGNLTVVEWRNWTKGQARKMRQRESASKARQWHSDPKKLIVPSKSFRPKEAPIFAELMREYHNKILLESYPITVDHFGLLS